MTLFTDDEIAALTNCKPTPAMLSLLDKLTALCIDQGVELILLRSMEDIIRACHQPAIDLMFGTPMGDLLENLDAFRAGKAKP